MTKGGEGVQNRLKMRDVICECSLSITCDSDCLNFVLVGVESPFLGLSRDQMAEGAKFSFPTFRSTTGTWKARTICYKCSAEYRYSKFGMYIRLPAKNSWASLAQDTQDLAFLGKKFQRTWQDLTVVKK